MGSLIDQATPDVAFLSALWLGKPAWLWLAFLVLVFTLLILDLGVFGARRTPRPAVASAEDEEAGASGSGPREADDLQEIGVRRSLALSAFYIFAGLAFGGYVWWSLGPKSGMEYLTGFAVEKALALDNVFVIAMIFGYFSIPRAYQRRVLIYGVLGVVVLRAVMIGLGAAIVSQFSWVLHLFAAFLVITGVKMMFAKDEAYDVADNPVLRFMRKRFNVADGLRGQKFVVREPGPDGRSVLRVTPLFLALVLIEIADLVFAVDSVPAVLAITSDPFIVYTSNIFAILGLRALYFALAAMVARFGYLKYALAAVLVFIGGKIFVADMLGIEKIPPVVSLAVTFGLLAAGVLASLLWGRESPRLEAKRESATS